MLLWRWWVCRTQIGVGRSILRIYVGTWRSCLALKQRFLHQHRQNIRPADPFHDPLPSPNRPRCNHENPSPGSPPPEGGAWLLPPRCQSLFFCGGRNVSFRGGDARRANISEADPSSSSRSSRSSVDAVAGSPPFSRPFIIFRTNPHGRPSAHRTRLPFFQCAKLEHEPQNF